MVDNREDDERNSIAVSVGVDSVILDGIADGDSSASGSDDIEGERRR